MTRRGREFVGNRLRRSPPDRANAVSCGQGAENAARFPHLAHRPAVAHKPHGTAAATGRIDSAFDSGDHQNRQPGTGFSLSPPGTCPNTRNRRRPSAAAWSIADRPTDSEGAEERPFFGANATDCIGWPCDRLLPGRGNRTPTIRPKSRPGRFQTARSQIEQATGGRQSPT